MTFLRSLLFNGAFFAFTALATMLATPLLSGPPRRILAVQRGIARGVLWLLRAICGIRVEATGLERIPRDGPALIASRHQSAFDTVVWFALVPSPCYVMKRELLSVPFYGWVARASRMIPVDRAAGAKAMRGLLRAGQEAAREGRQVVIFPEGTRTAPGEAAPFQPGVAALAAAMKLPVIPVATDSGLRWGRRAFAKRPGIIHVRVLEPVPPGLPKEDLLRELEGRIAAEQARLGA